MIEIMKAKLTAYEERAQHQRNEARMCLSTGQPDLAREFLQAAVATQAKVDSLHLALQQHHAYALPPTDLADD